jgi:hypothetical protein
MISLNNSTLSTTTRTWHSFLGTESHPVFCVTVFPLVSLLPSIPLRRQIFTTIVRELRRYYEAVRIPMTVHRRRASLDFTARTTTVFTAVTNHGASRFSRRLIGYMLKVSDPAKHPPLSPLRAMDCCLPDISRPSALGFNILSGLNTWPISNPVNASSASLRIRPHDSGSLSMASRLKVNRNTNNQSAGLSRRTEN